MWVEVVRRAWLNPFSNLRRQWFELGQIKDLIISDQLNCKTISTRRKTQPLDVHKTITMDTVRIEQ